MRNWRKHATSSGRAAGSLEARARMKGRETSALDDEYEPRVWDSGEGARRRALVRPHAVLSRCQFNYQTALLARRLGGAGLGHPESQTLNTKGVDPRGV